MGGPLAAAGTIPGVVERAAASYAGRPALVGDGPGPLPSTSSWSWCESAAGALIEAGVGAGDRVALWAPNTPEWAMASLAVLFAGGSVVPGQHALHRRGGGRPGEPGRLPGRARRGRVRGPEPGPGGGRHAGTAHRRLTRSHDCRAWPRGRSLPARAQSSAELDQQVGRAHARRRESCAVHLGHDRRAEGRHAPSRRHGGDHGALGRGGRVDGGGLLPGGEPVLAYRRPQDGAAGLPGGGRHDGSGGQLRSRTLRADRGRTRRSPWCKGHRLSFTR